MNIVLGLLCMIIFHFPVSGVQRRPGKSPKNVIKYIPGIHNYVIVSASNYSYHYHFTNSGGLGRYN